MLRRAEYVFENNFPAVVKNGRTTHFPEDLMLVRANELPVNFGSPVDDRDKIHLKAPVRGRVAPFLQIADRISAASAAPSALSAPVPDRVRSMVARDQKHDIIQLMRCPIPKENILTRRPRIPEAITDIKSEAVSIHITAACSPVPGVLVSPHSSSPVQGSKIRPGVESVNPPVKQNLAGSTHAVDFLIVVEGVFPIPGRGNHHRIHVRLIEEYIAFQGLSMIEISEIAD